MSYFSLFSLQVTYINVRDAQCWWRHNIHNITLCVYVWVTQSCLTLCDPMDCSSPGFSVHGILQARTLEWVAIPYSFLQGISPTQGLNPGLLHGRQILYHLSHQGSPNITLQRVKHFIYIYTHNIYIYTYIFYIYIYNI